MLGALRFYLGTTPWALPVLAVAAIGLSLSARRLAARTGWPVWLIVAFGMSLAGFVGVTATPGSGAGFHVSDGRNTSWNFHVPTLRNMAQIIDPWQVSEPALNAWLAIPLGFTATLAALRMRSAWPAVTAVVVPFAAEWVQWAFPGFGRAAFLFGDVTANWTGIFIGAIGAMATMSLITCLRRLRASRVSISRSR